MSEIGDAFNIESATGQRAILYEGWEMGSWQ